MASSQEADVGMQMQWRLPSAIYQCAVGRAVAAADAGELQVGTRGSRRCRAWGWEGRPLRTDGGEGGGTRWPPAPRREVGEGFLVAAGTAQIVGEGGIVSSREKEGGEDDRRVGHGRRG